MTNRPTLLAVSDDEWLARFILFRNQIRRDQTVKQDAFIPYPYPDLSVTRRLGLTDNELWELGQEFANSRPATCTDELMPTREPLENNR
ncbi:MAG: hypothetical protein ACR2G5_17685 [Pyrinomonadaceae bacterium]